MRSPILLFLLILGALTLNAQNKKTTSKKAKKTHKIIMQLSTGDPEVHKGLMRQLGHILEEAPDTKIEVVCHGPGMDMLIREKTGVYDKIKDFTTKGVIFFACENTMKQKNIERDAVVNEAGYVKAGIIYIVERQELGWSYIKAGF